MPLLPFGAIFHSSDSSKFLHFSVVMMSAARRTRVSAPSTTCHPDGRVSIFHPRQPVVVLPSNRSRHPAVRSAGVRVLRDACARAPGDRKSTRLNSSHSQISYAVFCLKKKKKDHTHARPTARR